MQYRKRYQRFESSRFRFNWITRKESHLLRCSLKSCPRLWRGAAKGGKSFRLRYCYHCPMSFAITIHNLQKTYANGVSALKWVDLNVPEGEFFGLLGPNGAGKTTIIGIVTGLVNKTGGTVEILGHDLDTETSLAKASIGVVPQEFNFGIFEKVIDIIVNQAGYYGIPRHEAF